MINKKMALLSTAALFELSASSFAQQSSSDPNGQLVLEEVKVTARFREETIQDIGAGITGVSGATIEKRGVASLDDLARSVAGVSNVRLRQNDNEFAIRGVSNLAISFQASSSVFSVYVDEISVASTFGQRDFGMFDLDRVELIRGPQPTLFGESAVGGVMRYFTRDPDLNGSSISGNASAELASTRDGGLAYKANNATSLILSPGKVGLRLSGYYTKDEGFIDNRLSGEKDANDFDSFGGRAVLLMEPNDQFSARLSAFFGRDEGGLDNQIQPGSNPSDLSFGLEGATDGSFPDFVGNSTDDINLYSVNLTYDFDSFQVSSITGYYERDRTSNTLDIPTSVGIQPFFPTISTTSFGSAEFNETTLSQEFRFISNFDGPLNFIGGVYYRDREIDLNRSLVIPELPAVSAPATDVGQQNVTHNESSHISGFVEGRWDISDKLRLIAGGRYISDEFTSEFTEVVANLSPFTAPYSPDNPIDFLSIADLLGFLNVAPPYEFKLEEFLPRATVEYDLNDDVLFYVVGARGIRNGGVGQPLAALTLAGDPTGPDFLQNFANNLFYDSDSVYSLEAGIKASFLDGALTANIDVFRSKFEDAQVFVLVPVSNTINGPDQIIKGIEVETSYRWNDNFTIFLNATLLDSGFQENFSITGLGVDVRKGNDVVNAPSLAFTFGYDFSMPLNNGWNVFSVGDFNYVGERFTGPANFPSEELNSLELLNLRVGLENENLSVTAFVKNVFNELEAIATGTNIGEASRDPNGFALDAPLSDQFVNHPRSFGVSISYRY